MKSNKILGILLLLIYVCVATALLNDNFIKPYNLQNLLRSSSMFAIIGIGAVMVIVTGGIDLSTGSLIGLVGCTMTLTLKSWVRHPPSENGSFLFQLIGFELIGVAVFCLLWETLYRRRRPFANHAAIKIALGVVGGLLLGIGFWIGGQEFGGWMTVAVAVALALLLSIHLGLLHGILITKLQLQPFIVTLCGLMCYRGLSRWLTGDKTQGLGTEYNDTLRLLAIGKPCTATAVLLCGSIAVVVYGLWRTFFGKSSGDRRSEIAIGLTTAVLGLILAVVASSRYWDGWNIASSETLMTLGQFELKFFTLDLSETAIHRPALLMTYAIYPLLLSIAALFFLAIKSTASLTERTVSDWMAILLPALVAAASIAGLYFLKRWIGDQSVILEKLQSETFVDKIREMISSDIIQKMAGVFLSMAALIGAVIWMGKSWTRNTGVAGRVLWICAGFFSVLWLLGNTSINETVVQTPFFFLVVVGAMAAIFLNMTIWGRYLQALGNNEVAAKFSGVNIDNMKILAYVLCAFCGGLGAILFTLDSNNVEPSGHGSFYELYAIAAAVLGGSSLRGGEGSILGVIIGASIMRVLYNAPDMIGIASQLEMFTIGIVILIGVIVDETSRRISARRIQSTA